MGCIDIEMRCIVIEIGCIVIEMRCICNSSLDVCSVLVERTFKPVDALAIIYVPDDALYRWAQITIAFLD